MSRHAKREFGALSYRAGAGIGMETGRYPARCVGFCTRVSFGSSPTCDSRSSVLHPPKAAAASAMTTTLNRFPVARFHLLLLPEARRLSGLTVTVPEFTTVPSMTLCVLAFKTRIVLPFEPS